VGAAAVVLYFKQGTVQKLDVNFSQKQAVVKPALAKQLNTEHTDSENNINHSSVTSLANKTSSEITTIIAADTEPFYTQFKTEQDINTSFIRHDNAIYQSTLISTFKTENFGQFIATLDSVTEDHASIENKQQLSDYLVQQYDARISNERYSCAGRICAISFNYPADTDEKSLKTFNDFGSYFSFSNHSQDEYGNLVMKTILITTDDPSSLTIAR
jgi:hypothetical protein